MNILSKEQKEQRKVAREERISVDFVRRNGEQSKRLIAGLRRGYNISQKALEHTYNANIGR